MRELRTRDQYLRAEKLVKKLESQARKLECTCDHRLAKTKDELMAPGTCERCLLWERANAGSEYILMYLWQEKGDYEKAQIKAGVPYRDIYRRKKTPNVDPPRAVAPPPRPVERVPPKEGQPLSVVAHLRRPNPKVREPVPEARRGAGGVLAYVDKPPSG